MTVVAKVTIGHILVPPLQLVVDKIAPTVHQDPSICAISDKEKNTNCSLTQCNPYSLKYHAPKKIAFLFQFQSRKHYSQKLQNFLFKSTPTKNISILLVLPEMH